MYSLRSSFEKSGRKFLRVEGAQILDGFTDADPFHWHGELALDADDYAAFGGAVELGEDHARDWCGLGEELGLADGILAGGRIENQQGLVRGLGDLAADDAVDLLQFLHEVGFRLQTAGRIDDENIDVAGLGCLDGIKGYGSRV